MRGVPVHLLAWKIRCLLFSKSNDPFDVRHKTVDSSIFLMVRPVLSGMYYQPHPTWEIHLMTIRSRKLLSDEIHSLAMRVLNGGIDPGNDRAEKCVTAYLHWIEELQIKNQNTYQ